MKNSLASFIPSGLRQQRVVAVGIVCLLAGASAFAAGSVKAPPLPPGSSMVKVKVGQSPEEEQRGERAHKHKAGKTDPTGDKQVDKQGSKS